jgi:spermidine synthase
MNTRTIKQTLVLFIIIIIEGYVVLSTELLAIRQTIPYVGSGTDTVAVIIAAILMPLAFGYQFGGRYKAKKIFGHYVSVRKRLIYNICIAATFLFAGLSYIFLHSFFQFLTNDALVGNLVLQVAIFCSVFLVIPIYLLGQTVPLIANFFTKEYLPKITGHILFFSTLGSFLGAIFSTLIFMAILGVHHTLTLNFVLMATLVIILSKKTKSFPVIYITVLAFLAMLINSDTVMKTIYPYMKANNQYNLIQAGPSTTNEIRMMKINLNNSSAYKNDGTKHPYINIAEEIAIKPILEANPPKNILVIGAGGFTFGHNDTNNNYTYIDIDKDLKPIAERYVLQEPIGDNKQFIAKPARAFLYNEKSKYDVIYIDAYLGRASVPDHLVTQEFFIQVKDHLTEGGVLLTNFIVAPNFNDSFSQSLDSTFRSVFPYVSRVDASSTIIEGSSYNLWGDNPDELRNVAYIYRHKEYGTPNIYTDNKNKVIYEKPKY